MSGKGTAVIVGVGPGLGAALCRRFAREGMNVAAAARDAADADKAPPHLYAVEACPLRARVPGAEEAKGFDAALVEALAGSSALGGAAVSNSSTGLRLF